MKRTLSVLCVAGLLAALIAMAGCLPQGAKRPENPSGGKQIKLAVFLPDKTAMYLERKEITVTDSGEALALQALKELIRDGTTIPKGTKVRGVTVQDRIARVDFSRELRDNHWGGTLGESFTIYSIVCTLTDLDGIDRVQILIEGKTGESIGGHMVLDEPLGPDAGLLRR